MNRLENNKESLIFMPQPVHSREALEMILGTHRLGSPTHSTFCQRRRTVSGDSALQAIMCSSHFSFYPNRPALMLFLRLHSSVVFCLSARQPVWLRGRMGASTRTSFDGDELSQLCE
ncbi:hypothetical protein RRG08_036174 [Elysia crispata]|uniref:Uncharacterized protein n=1 Tax=Elysia crispata TaxID=231223 RepID=A0AAE0XE23_9GAST|nr:hypothetical protein RRG08_036174 [Elysia crispata]